MEWALAGFIALLWAGVGFLAYCAIVAASRADAAAMKHWKEVGQDDGYRDEEGPVDAAGDGV